MRWRRFIIPGGVVVAAVALLALLTYGVSNHADTGSIDNQVATKHYPRAPDYTTPLPVLDSSKTMSLAAFKGKITVVNIYASWCPPCQAEAPLLAREQKVLVKHGATMVGITYLNRPSAATAFNKKYGITYPVLRDASGTFAHQFGTFQLPETFVINRQGKIQALQRYEVSKQWFAKTLMPILTAKS